MDIVLQVSRCGTNTFNSSVIAIKLVNLLSLNGYSIDGYFCGLYLLARTNSIRIYKLGICILAYLYLFYFREINKGGGERGKHLLFHTIRHSLVASCFGRNHRANP